MGQNDRNFTGLYKHVYHLENQIWLQGILSLCWEISLLGDHFNWFVGPKIMFWAWCVELTIKYTPHTNLISFLVRHHFRIYIKGRWLQRWQRSIVVSIVFTHLSISSITDWIISTFSITFHRHLFHTYDLVMKLSRDTMRASMFPVTKIWQREFSEADTFLTSAEVCQEPSSILPPSLDTRNIRPDFYINWEWATVWNPGRDKCVMTVEITDLGGDQMLQSLFCL